MRLAAYLSRSRHGVFYFRWPLPAGLHPSRKRSHVRLSLRTRCPRTAQRLSRALVLAGQTQLLAASDSGMRYSEIREHVAAHFRQMLRQFEDDTDNNGPAGGLRLEALAAAQGLAEADSASWGAAVHPDGADGLLREFCGLRGIAFDDLTGQYRGWLLDALRSGHAAYAKEALARTAALGTFDLRGFDGPAAQPPAGGAAVKSPEGYAEVTAQYLDELQRTGQVRGKTLDSKREALALLGEITGYRPPADLTKADARQVKDTLLRYPRNRNKLEITKGKPLAEVLDLPGVEVIAVRTANAYISALQTFYGWAVANGHAPDNIFDGTRFKQPKQAKDGGRAAFTDAQLRLIFQHLTENPAGLVRNKDHKWISLIGLFTGMRLNEIAQLDLADVGHDDGLWSLTVTDAGSENKRLKNAASQRRLPLHDRLVAAGFPEFIAERRQGRSPRLFPELPYCPKNGYGRNPGRWFNERLLPKLGMDDGKLVFHSLRHTMATKLARSDVPETQIKALLGHEQQGVTFSIYFHGFAPAPLKAAIERFEF